MSAIDGFHHVTACVAGAQEDIDFCTQTLGAQLIKQTVLLDGDHGVYHLYYADPDASVGNVLTTFPYAQRGIYGHRGTGQVSAFGLTVPLGSLDFWTERFARLAVPHDPVSERFGEPTLRFRHPSGLEFELIEATDDPRTPWSNDEIPAEHAIRGLRSVTMSVRETTDHQRFMTELGFGVTNQDEAFTRLEINGGGPANIVDLHHQPDAEAGTWTYAAGTVHHVAFAVAGETEQLELKARLEALGYVDVSEIKNRNYFRSIYVRSPGGILFEFATKGPGFAIDEPADRLGQRLLLPDWYETRREAILADLEPIRAPRG